ncbi:MAG: peptidase T [Clostridia bacterium]|nr:peptidase T [Clostridia bacterium]
MSEFYQSVRDRLIRYARVNTQSGRNTGRTPTTERQFDLARMLLKELQEIGVDASLDEGACIVYATLPSNLEHGRDIPFALIAHMDTSPDAPSDHVCPHVVEHYDGADILLNEEKNIVMSPKEFPNLLLYVGQDLVVTDGTTLLGGDDKASIAAIMTFAEHLIHHPEIRHGTIALAFTPDEEVGGLAKDLDLDRLGARVAYTLDGDHLGYYEFETFNASEATLTVTGRSVHPGTSKNTMVNAVDIACQFASMLPPVEKPQHTSGREGFFHVVSVHGNCEKAEVYLIIRDHDMEKFEEREKLIQSIADELALRYGKDRISLTIHRQYLSMKPVVDNVPYLVDNLKEAIRSAGVTPIADAFRGGTDGSALSHRGLPCPNLSAGYENAHGRFEYVPIQSMEKNVEILLHLCRLFTEVPE